MDINSMQGINAYTANRPPTESTLTQNQNRQAVETDLDKENTREAQQAFEVNITQEARAAAEAENRLEAQPVEPPQPPDQSQNTGNRQQASPIVDIVA